MRLIFRVGWAPFGTKVSTFGRSTVSRVEGQCMEDQRAGGYPRVAPCLPYADVAEALAWLEEAFGLRERLRFADEDGRVNHAEMTVGDDGLPMLGSPGSDYRKPKQSGVGERARARHARRCRRALSARSSGRCEDHARARRRGLRRASVRRAGPRGPLVVLRPAHQGRRALQVGRGHPVVGERHTDSEGSPWRRNPR